MITILSFSYFNLQWHEKLALKRNCGQTHTRWRSVVVYMLQGPSTYSQLPRLTSTGRIGQTAPLRSTWNVAVPSNYVRAGNHICKWNNCEIVLICNQYVFSLCSVLKHEVKYIVKKKCIIFFWLIMPTLTSKSGLSLPPSLKKAGQLGMCRRPLNTQVYSSSKGHLYNVVKGVYDLLVKCNFTLLYETIKLHKST